MQRLLIEHFNIKSMVHTLMSSDQVECHQLCMELLGNLFCADNESCYKLDQQIPCAFEIILHNFINPLIDELNSTQPAKSLEKQKLLKIAVWCLSNMLAVEMISDQFLGLENALLDFIQRVCILENYTSHFNDSAFSNAIFCVTFLVTQSSIYIPSLVQETLTLLTRVLKTYTISSSQLEEYIWLAIR